MASNRAERKEIWKAIAWGGFAGAVGTLVMTLAEKAEQKVTKRPNSYIPAHNLERLLGLEEVPDTERGLRNLTMHFSTGIAIGAMRGLMARAGVRGLTGFFAFTGARFSLDQLLENASGLGAPPGVWPLDERLIDLGHKSIYAAVTGAVADAAIKPIRRERYPEIWDNIERQSPYQADQVRRNRPDRILH